MCQGTVIYAGGFVWPHGNAAAQRALGNAKLLRDRGYRVVLVGVDRGATALQTLPPVDGFDCYALPYPRTPRQWIGYLTDCRALWEIGCRYDDVVAYLAYNYPAVALHRLAKRAHRQGVVVLGDVTEWYAAGGQGPLFWLLKGMDTGLRMRWVHKHLDGLVVISGYLARYYRGRMPLVVLPPLVDAQEPQWHTPRAEPTDTCRLVYAGSPGADKDRLDELVAAVADTPACRLQVIGLSREEYAARPGADAILDRCPPEAVAFCGRLSHEETLVRLRQADYACFFRSSSRVTEAGFPTKYVESVTCGVPVICNGTSDLAAYARRLDNGLLLPDASGAAIRRALAGLTPPDEALRRRCEEARDTFDYRRYDSVMQRFLNEVFARSRQSKG